ncbi:TetR/AcrR family transcriptional regulator [Flavonifractor sp. DFI.6.63]|jgi:hypothetical protein|uniref:TetR/AcrR family transcriptional regulator C-terminal domain-containing protein n=1 Tax=Lawsonibacter hominis TaxID=2763053 RepID=A0A8J6JGB7_9FIRM|nr:MULTISPECIES: TetR/AcrR family transcriptional regulator [Oscillospiraceae]MBS1384849.1 TetR family transcriptional regulator [Flavonifractor sp.]MDU2196514.1 TetR/AcrR family transcriptional regulator C-terminal domain-containing protein [Clostridiales bacterium]MDY2977799.1 TetR/AcrR family transcriptional regulator C-terminal domain-containing protein [Oscillospiraceae bacterium]MBC5734709.1 TetR/AcrR family transcriptional regulator C-terminal domain-containing protein [Lawsonibacter hom
MSQITKRALAESLKKLLLEKPLDRITVSDITEDCGVSRMTFYYHFKDVYDLIEWTWLQEAERALDGQKTYDTWQQGFLQIFQLVQENRAFVMNLYHSISREQVERYLYRLTYQLLIGVVEEKSAGMSVRDEDKKFIADFYKYAFVGLMLDWIRGGMKGEPQVLIDRLSVLIRGDVEKALNHYRADQMKQSGPND